jgi:GNAT superfamily N-acetyltransferase
MLKARSGTDIEVRAMREGDRDRFRAMTSQSFSLPAQRTEVHASTLLDEAWVICNNGNMLGGLRGEIVGQFFGGKSVPCAVVSAVQILPEGRGKGYGNLLMTGAMSKWRDNGSAMRSRKHIAVTNGSTPSNENGGVKWKSTASRM